MARMIRGPIALGLWALLASAHARAEATTSPFGTRHQFVVAVEHLAGFAYTRQDLEIANGSHDSTSKQFWLLGNTTSLYPPYSTESVYTPPRVGVDFFLANHFSLGTSVLVDKAASQNNGWGILVAPRLGYATALGSRWALWPRAGFTYVHQSNDGPTTGSGARSTLYALTLEVPVVLAVTGRAFASCALSVNLGLGGSGTYTVPFAPTTAPFDVKQTDYGVSCSLGAFF